MVFLLTRFPATWGIILILITLHCVALIRPQWVDPLWQRKEGGLGIRLLMAPWIHRTNRWGRWGHILGNILPLTLIGSSLEGLCGGLPLAGLALLTALPLVWLTTRCFGGYGCGYSGVVCALAAFSLPLQWAAQSPLFWFSVLYVSLMVGFALWSWIRGHWICQHTQQLHGGHLIGVILGALPPLIL
ncbi:MAG: rhomboid family intramembrane serine protease [Chlamydiota bacterium]|nr:rhomboid family intramembrane serine protease [Chlamydiota bacterium]